MTAPISRDALRNMSGGRPAAAPGANVPGVQTPAQRAQSDAFDPTVTVPLLGTDGTSVDQLPPMAQIMPPSFAPQQVHDVNAANVGRNIEEDLPDQPLWGQLKIKVIAIVVALVLLVVGLVAAWFILNGDNHGGGSDNQDWPNKTDIDNVPFGNSTTQNSTSKNSAAQSEHRVHPRSVGDAEVLIDTPSTHGRRGVSSYAVTHAVDLCCGPVSCSY